MGLRPAVLRRGRGRRLTLPVPDHTLLRRIGKGSYGEVWIARNVLGVYRAVKIIQRSSFDHDRPFEREFAGMQRFEPVSRSHESQLNILQVGRGPDCFYYVMELADDMGHGAAIDEGSYTPRNLRSELLLRGRLPVDECLRLGLALTTALGHLHRHGLVHRDIKPSNIVFVNGIPKLADIGLVARAEATMSFVGTEGYLPPEGPGTVQADVFSLGKVLYEISTGRDRQQFPELPTGITELPDRAALAEFNEVLLRACAPDVKQRYESAAEMHADLALLQSGKSVARMRAVERRLKFAARAAVAVTVIAVLAGLAFFYQQSQTREARRLAAENKTLANENRERLVRLDIANGVRLLDEGDPSAALLWFADALPLVTNRPAEEAIHRIRIQQVLDQTPRLLRVMAEGENTPAGAFSPDGMRIATGTVNGRLRVRDTRSGQVVWERSDLGGEIAQLRFSRDGRRLLASSSPIQGNALWLPAPQAFVGVLDAGTGKAAFPVVRTSAGGEAHLVFSTISPDDRWFAVAQSNHVIRILDVRDGQSVVELVGHTSRVTMLSFSANGNLLASAGEDHTARLWSIPSGEPLGAPLWHECPLSRAVLSGDGHRLATATKTGTEGGNCVIQTWDTQTGARIGPPINARNSVYALAFDGGTGRRLLTDGDEFMARVWDAETHVQLLPPLKMDSAVRCWAFSPHSSCIALGSDDNTAYLWNLETGELLFPPFRHTGWVESVAFSPDGTRLLTTSDDRTTKLWSLESIAESASLRLGGQFPNHLADYFRPSGKFPGPIPIELTNATLSLIDPSSLTEVRRLAPSKPAASLASWEAGARGGHWALCGAGADPTAAHEVDLWYLEGNQLRHRVLGHPKRVKHMAFTPDETRLVTAGEDNIVRFWRTEDGVLEREMPIAKPRFIPDYPNGPFTPDRRAILVHRDEEGGFLELLDLQSGRTVGAAVPAKGLMAPNRWAFDAQGIRLAQVGEDQAGTIIDFRTGRLATPPFKSGGSLFSVDWSPDGRRLLTAGLGPDPKIWDTATGEQLLASLKIGAKAALVALWSPDGRLIVTRSDAGFARVWDAATAEAVTPLLRHEGYIRFAFITPNQRLITASDPNLLRAWDLKATPLPQDVLADYAKLLSGRRLSAAGVMLPLKSEELAALLQPLRARAPQLFATP